MEAGPPANQIAAFRLAIAKYYHTVVRCGWTAGAPVLLANFAIITECSDILLSKIVVNERSNALALNVL